MTRGGGSPTLLMVEHELCSSCNLYSGTHLLCPQHMYDEAHVHCPCAFKHLLCLHISTGTCSPLRGAGPVSPMSLLLPALHPNALSCTCATVPNSANLSAYCWRCRARNWCWCQSTRWRTRVTTSVTLAPGGARRHLISAGE